MAQRILRPLSFGDLLDEMFDLYKKNFLLFAGIAGILIIPLSLIVYSAAPKNAQSSLYTLIMLLTSFIATAAATWSVSRVYLGGSTTILESYKTVMSRLPALLWTMVVAFGLLLLAFVPLLLASVFMSLAAIGGSMAGIGAIMLVMGIATAVLLVIFAFWVSFISQVVMLEGISGPKAIGRSRFLTAGNFGRIFLTGLLIGLINIVVTLVLTIPFGGIAAMFTPDQSGSGIAYGLSSGIASTLTTPIQIITFVLMYYDIRVRKEGFDLEMLAQNMGEASITTMPTDKEAPAQ